MSKIIMKLTSAVLCFVLFVTNFAANGMIVNAAPRNLSIWELAQGDLVNNGDSIEDKKEGKNNDIQYTYVALHYCSSVDTATGAYVPYAGMPSHMFYHNGTIDEMEVVVSPDISSWKIGMVLKIAVSYFVFLIPNTGEGGLSEEQAGPVKPAAYGCSHICEWITETKATETQDGVMAYVCTSCGAVTDYMTGGTDQSSAYAVFNKNVIDKVNKAQSGEKIVIDTRLWTSFSQSVMETIAARRDVEIVLTYRLSGTTYQIVIPTGTQVPADVAYAGFDGYLAGLYGKTEMNK